MTNLEKLQLHFPALKPKYYATQDIYTIGTKYQIIWRGDREDFLCVWNLYEPSIGASGTVEIIRGDFDQCLNALLKEIPEVFRKE